MTAPAGALSASDRIMWRIEADPVLRSPIVVVGLLDRAPERARLEQAFARAVERVPRLGQVVRYERGRPARWAPAPDFDPAEHVTTVRAAEPGTLRSVLDIAQATAADVFDPVRPPWYFELFDGLEGGRAAFVLRFHHAISDGVGAIGLASELFDTGRRAHPDAPADTAAPPPSPTAWSRLGAAVTDGAGALMDPFGTAASAARLARSVRRMLAPAAAPLSPLWTGRGVHRHLDVVEVPLDALRSTAHRMDVTINELFLGVVGGAVHGYHQRKDTPLRGIRVTMPISIRDPGDGPGGNHFVPARFVLPIDDPDLRTRARLASTVTRRWRAEPALRSTNVLAAGLDLLPDGAVGRVFGSMLKSVDIDAVDVPGLEHDAYLGGARIDRMWAYSPPTGAATSVTLLSHGRTACVGVLCDRAAVEDPQLFASCVRAGFDAAVAGGAPEHPARRGPDRHASGRKAKVAR